MRKYKIDQSESIQFSGHTLYRIVALKKICGGCPVTKGDKGGWVESESNLSQEGTCWIHHECKVFDGAVVKESARIFDNVSVSDKAIICGNAFASGGVSGRAKIFGDATISENSRISDDAIVFGNAHVGGRSNVYGYSWILGNANIENEECVDVLINGNS